MSSELITSKITGTLLGVVVGDLLGEQVEGKSNPGAIRKFRKFARYTDDTEMTLITLQHLMAFETIKPLSITLEYAINADPSRKYGGNAYKTLKSIKKSPETWDVAYKEFLEDGSWGNGCLMRISPIALFDLEAPIEQLKKHLEDCLQGTHSNDEALQCSIEYCLILRNFFKHNPDEIIAQGGQFLDDIIGRNLNQRLTDKVILIKNKLIESNEINKYDQLSKFINTELVEHSIRSTDTLSIILALLTYNIKHKQWTPSALLPIIISFGGDTDTNAAILGSLLGALYGVNWIDVDWFENIENKKNITDLFQRYSEKLIKTKRISVTITEIPLSKIPISKKISLIDKIKTYF